MKYINVTTSEGRYTTKILTGAAKVLGINEGDDMDVETSTMASSYRVAFQNGESSGADVTNPYRNDSAEYLIMYNAWNEGRQQNRKDFTQCQ